MLVAQHQDMVAWWHGLIVAVRSTEHSTWPGLCIAANTLAWRCATAVDTASSRKQVRSSDVLTGAALVTARRRKPRTIALTKNASFLYGFGFVIIVSAEVFEMVPCCRAAFRFALAPAVRFAFTSCVVCASVSRPGLCVCVCVFVRCCVRLCVCDTT
jgi:hypothetical protein